jgi:hypothetical protein
MQEAIEVLEKAESVLMKRIRVMRTGIPKWAAAERLAELRMGLRLIKQNYHPIAASETAETVEN